MEADKIASVLCANAGYNPFAISEIVNRLEKEQSVSKDIFDDNYLAPNDLKKRSNEISEFLLDNYELENPGADMQDRFNKYSNVIR